MTFSNDLNLPEFDLEVYQIATELEIPEAFEIAVEVAKQDDSEFIPLDDYPLNEEENN